MKEKAFALLTQWCDALILRQNLQIAGSGLYGGILCPACSVLHGRSFDAVYPLLYLAEQTGEKRYADAAAALLVWAEHVSCPDGSWINDTTSNWKGTTTFAAIALSEALPRYGKLLPPELLSQTERRLEKAYAFLYRDFDPLQTNINYLAATAYALLLGGLRYGKQEYKEKASALVELLMQHISENGLIAGEGQPWNQRTAKGCLPIDIGYNMEETLNLLALYAYRTQDDALYKRIAQSASAHLIFFLPDGGMDNSFGSRNDKWTYWGSRTADGCFPFLLLLRDYNPDFEYAAAQYLEQLRACTHEGILMGGRDLAAAGEPGCIHHLFTHAKSLTFLCEFYAENKQRALSHHFPCQSVEGFRYFSELDTYLYNRGAWRATFTGYDFCHKPGGHVTGGAVSLLRHAQAGLLLAAGMVSYTRFEVNNTQRHKNDRDDCLALRYALPDADFSNVLDKEALLQAGEDCLSAASRVVNRKGIDPPGGIIYCNSMYTMQKDSFTFTGRHNSAESLCFYLPLITQKGDILQKVSQNEYCVIRHNLHIHISASCAFDSSVACIFNHVPGFTAFLFVIHDAPKELTVRIRVTPSP